MTSKTLENVSNHVSKMSLRLEQRYAIKFCFRLKESLGNVYKMLQEAYEEKAISQKQVRTWYRAFKAGRESCETMLKSGRPVTVSEETVGYTASILNEDGRLTLNELSVVLKVSRTSVHSILKKQLDLTHVCFRWVPSLLAPAQKMARVKACQLWKEKAREYGDEWLCSLIMVDEVWLYCFNADDGDNGVQFVKKSRGKRSKIHQPNLPLNNLVSKVQVLIFYDYHGLVHIHSLPRDSFSMGPDYCIALGELIQKCIPLKRPELIGKWSLFYNNSQVHIAVSVTEFLEQNGISYVPQPVNSPDLTPSDFFLYPALKKRFKGLEFNDEIATLSAVEEALNAMPKNDFKDAFDEWQKRWDACIDADGEYVDHVNVTIC